MKKALFSQIFIRAMIHQRLQDLSEQWRTA